MLKWHYQFSPHNEFDWDSTQIPVLADMDWQGRPRKVMLWANRNGMSYVLDRATGQFLKGAAVRQSELGRWLRREGPTDSGSRDRADQGRHARLSGQPGRHELVQPVVQPAHRSVLHSGVGEHVHHLYQGRHAAGVPGGAGLHRPVPAAGPGDRRCPQLDPGDRSEDGPEAMDLPARRRRQPRPAC